MSRRSPLAQVRSLGGLLLLAFVVIAAGIGLRDPSPTDEPRFALMAKHMVDSGEWQFPHRGRELYSDKPPMFMWLQAASYELVGSWRVAFLLPSLLASLGTLLLVHDLARRLHGRRAARYAFLALLFTVHFTFQAKRAQIDPTITFLITLSLYGLLRHLLLGPAWRWYALGWFAAGLGTITKGVGFLSLLVLVPYLYAALRGWRRMPALPPRDWRWLTGPPLFALAASLWLVPMLFAVAASNDPALEAYARDILFRQTAQRYADPWHHVKPAWYFLGVIATLWLPGALALPGLLPAWRRRLRRADARYLLPLGWAATVIAFFSFSPGKRDVYILPALPMVVLAASPLLPGLLRKRWLRAALLAFCAALAVATLGAGLAALLGDPGFERRVIAERGFEPDHTSAWWMLVVVGSTIAAIVLACRMRRAALATMGTMAAVWIAYGLWAAPLLNESSSAHGVMKEAGRRIGPDAELALVAWLEQNALQADRAFTDFGFLEGWQRQWRDAFVWLRAAPERRVVFALRDSLGPCIDASAVEDVGTANRREWVLVRADALVPDCDPLAHAGADEGGRTAY